MSKKSVFTNLLLLTLIVVFFGIFIKNVYEKREANEKKIESLEKQKDSLLHKVDSLDLTIVRRDSLIEIQRNKGIVLEQKIIDLRQEKHEKTNIVKNLSFDESFEFLSKFLSEESLD